MQSPAWTHDLHFILESLDALAEARERAGGPMPRFGLPALIRACQAQGLVATHAGSVEALGRHLLEVGWVRQDERLGLPVLTPVGQGALGALRARDGADRSEQTQSNQPASSDGPF